MILRPATLTRFSSHVTAFQIADEDANWDRRTFDLDRNVELADQRVGAPVNSLDPDWTAFKARGGKLLLYHGMSDGNISPMNTVHYDNSVLATMGSEQQDWVRLFLMPGMQHRGGGSGPNQVHYVAVVERWRELGTAPSVLNS